MKSRSTTARGRQFATEPHLELVAGSNHRASVARPFAGDPFMVSSSTRARTADAVWARVERLIQCVRDGKIYQAVGEFYAHDVELGRGALAPMFGLETAGGRKFRSRNEDAEWVGFRVHGVGVNGDTSFIECSLDFLMECGERFSVKQVSIAQWRDGKIVKECLIPKSCGARNTASWRSTAARR